MTTINDEIPDFIRDRMVPGDEVYVHPQGSYILVRNGDVTKIGPDGKVRNTSADAYKLAEGHGAWRRIYSASIANEPVAAPPKNAPINDVLAWLDGDA